MLDKWLVPISVPDPNKEEREKNRQTVRKEKEKEKRRQAKITLMYLVSHAEIKIAKKSGCWKTAVGQI